MTLQDARLLQHRIASAPRGARVVLDAGRYALDAQLVLEKSITLVGAPGKTVLDGQGMHGAVRVLGADQLYRFEHVAFENGTDDWGGALVSPNKSTLEFDQCRFAQNRSTKDGAAVYVEQTNGSF